MSRVSFLETIKLFELPVCPQLKNRNVKKGINKYIFFILGYV
jgi:hypothetical protein